MKLEEYKANQFSLLENYTIESDELRMQLEALDWAEVFRAVQDCIYKNVAQTASTAIQAPSYVEIEPLDSEAQTLHQLATEMGEDLIQQGKLALFTVAGGQGTRLNHTGPKGTLPVSPIKGKSLFQLFAERLRGIARKYETSILWYIMCSPLNVDDTTSFFEENQYFGLHSDDVVFLIQDVMPITDFSGNLVLSSSDSLAFSPNGHGGSIHALNSSGATQQMIDRGIEHLSYHQIDNPLYNLIDPLFIGLHALQQSDMSSRALIKTGPLEKLGNFVLDQNSDRLSIVEYSDFSSDLAHELESDGRLKYRAGSPAMHLFRLDFIQKIGNNESGLPYHRANKRVEHLGATDISNEPNCVKFETFIFDALPLAQNPLILEAHRNESFSPVKNRTGVDSLESSKRDQLKLAHDWVKSIKPSISDSVSFEIDPLSYPTQDDLTESAIPELSANQNYYISE